MMRYSLLSILIFLTVMGNTSKGKQLVNKKCRYVLFKKIQVPTSFTQNKSGQPWGGDIRIGDLNNDGSLDFVVYQAANNVEGGGVQPCFLGAFDNDGNILWKKGNKGEQPSRPGSVAIGDIDGDGENEVICLFVNDTSIVSPFSMKNVSAMILNGKNGTVEKEIYPSQFDTIKGKGPNWCHQRILLANFNGNATPQEFCIKLGKTIIAFDQKLNLLWNYYNGNDEYQNCPSYIPSVGDIDGDGNDEVNGGYYVLDNNGRVLWSRTLGRNMDSVGIEYWDNDSTKRAICSGYGFVMDAKGDTILMLGEDEVPHGQEVRVANFDSDYRGNEMMVRYNGHETDIKVVSSHEGKIIRKFNINESPNNTGVEAVYWNGKDKPAMLFSNGVLWTGKGERYCEFKELKHPPSDKKNYTYRQNWYHCITCDITGDDGEEVVVYNPWESTIYIFTAYQKKWKHRKKYHATSKQYNPRLMD